LVFFLSTGSPPPRIGYGDQENRFSEVDAEKSLRAPLREFLIGYDISEEDISDPKVPPSTCVGLNFLYNGRLNWAKAYTMNSYGFLHGLLKRLSVDSSVNILFSAEAFFKSDCTSFRACTVINSYGFADPNGFLLVMLENSAKVLTDIVQEEDWPQRVLIAMKLVDSVKNLLNHNIAFSDLTLENIGLFGDSVQFLDGGGLFDLLDFEANPLDEEGNLNFGTKRNDYPLPEEYEIELRQLPEPERFQPEKMQVYQLGCVLAQWLLKDPAFLIYNLNVLSEHENNVQAERYGELLDELDRAFEKDTKAPSPAVPAACQNTLLQLLRSCLAYLPKDRPCLNDVAKQLTRLEGFRISVKSPDKPSDETPETLVDDGAFTDDPL